MAQILSFNGYTRPAEQEKPEIIKAVDNSRYHGLIAGGGKYADEWDQIIQTAIGCICFWLHDGQTGRAREKAQRGNNKTAPLKKRAGRTTPE